LASAGAWGFTANVQAAEVGEGTDRFALLVGANVGDWGEPVLRHAEEDALRLAQTLRLLGNFPADQLVVMTGATATEVREALIRLNARVRERPQGVLLVFYSGHADEQSLHLAGTHMATAELKGLLVGSPATSRVLIVDACRSGSFIQLKGGKPVAPFAVPTFQEPAPEGFAVLTSSAASEDSQESGSLASSYFTYYINSGLIGAADQDRDRTVTLSELYAFASAETRAATANSLAGPQHPTFQFSLGGRHELVLTRLAKRDLRLGALRFAQPGRYLVQRQTPSGWSPPIAEIGAHDAGAELALEPGTYRVVFRTERDVSQRDFTVTGGEATPVELTQLVRLDLARNVRKGGLRSSTTGVSALAGWQSSDVPGGNLNLGSGPSLVLGLRHDRRRFSAEVRLGLERATVVGDSQLTFDHRSVGVSLVALRAFDVGPVTLAAGAAVGETSLHQSIDVTSVPATTTTAPVLASSRPSRWVTGLEYGPLAQLDIPLAVHTYLRFEPSFMWRTFFHSESGETRHVARLRFLIGLGTSF
jgi:hypothetical protein